MHGLATAFKLVTCRSTPAGWPTVPTRDRRTLGRLYEDCMKEWIKKIFLSK